MKCKAIEDLIYLKPDELEMNEAKALEQHLMECETCRANYNKQVGINKLISNLSKFEPQIDYSNEIEVKLPAKIFKMEFRSSLLDKLAELIYMPALRFSMIAMLFIISGFYIYEEGKTVISISLLEKNNQQYVSQKLYSGYSLDENDLTKYFPDVISYLSGKQDFTQISDDVLVINKKGLVNLISYSMFLNEIRSNLPKGFSQKYPDIIKAIEPGSYNKLLELSPEQREKLLHELNTIFSKGEK